MRRETVPIIGLACATLGACAGNGAGLDQNGRPFTDPTAPLTAEFASLQAHVFTPYCIGCHAGAGAPLGLHLTEDAFICGHRQSAERRAAYADAHRSEQSRRELSAAEGVGHGRRRWAHAARRPAAAGGCDRGVAAVDPRRRRSATQRRTVVIDPPRRSSLRVYPVEAAHVDFAMGAIVVSSNLQIDTTTLSGDNVRLTRSGGDRGFTEGGEQVLQPLRIEVRSVDPTILAITPPGAWTPDRYRLQILGTGAVPVRDLASQPIDGDGDLRAGGDFEILFDIDSEVRQ